MPKTPAGFLYRLFRNVMPLVRHEIAHWEQVAQGIPDATLRQQALASLTHKRFHADGGCVYAAVDPLYQKPLVRLIVALQTISDYLDNLCDRCHSYDAADFRQLHLAMRDAVRPGATLHDYYEKRGRPSDGGYLSQLVQTCQEVTGTLPNYSLVAKHVEWLVERYCELQEYKHIDPALRLQTLRTWCTAFAADYPHLDWWEFAAATGSTLGMFALFLSATRPLSVAEADSLFHGYFPWVCSMHILLDYLIDLEEDKAEGDFNFVRCYPSAYAARMRIRYIARQSLAQAKRLKNGGRIHQFVVRGLLGMYLSDAKVASQRQVRRVRSLVVRFGPTACVFYLACMLYRVVR